MVNFILSVYVAVVCDSGTVQNKANCVQYLNSCYKEDLKADWAKKYEKEYRKVIVFENCRQRGGYTRR